MIYRCTCGAEFTNKGQLISHCALLTPDWPRKTIWTGEHRPDYTKEEFDKLPKQKR